MTKSKEKKELVISGTLSKISQEKRLINLQKEIEKISIYYISLFPEKRSSFLKLLSDEEVGLVSVGPENSTKSEWFENLEWWLEILKPNRIFPVQPEIIFITNIGHTQDRGQARAVPAVTGQAKERNL